MGNLYVTVTEMDGKPFEVFATIGKSGKSTMAKTEAIGRLVSLALRSGITPDKIVEQLIERVKAHRRNGRRLLVGRGLLVRTEPGSGAGRGSFRGAGFLE